MEINEVKSSLARASKRAAIISTLGILIVVAALVFSFYYLNKQVEKSELLDTQISEKENRVEDLDRELSEKQQKLNLTEKVCKDYQDAVEKDSPKAAKIALEQTIENNPKAAQVINDIKTSTSEKIQIARAKEREGFQALIDGDYERAISALQASEDVYNSYNQVYELARFLRKNKEFLKDPTKRPAIFQQIVKQFPYGAPTDLWAQVKLIAENPGK